MDLWEQVKDYQEHVKKSLQELREGRATFLVNFGHNGRIARGVISDTDSIMSMIVSVHEYYNPKEKIKKMHCNECGSVTETDYHSCRVCGESL